MSGIVLAVLGWLGWLKVSIWDRRFEKVVAICLSSRSHGKLFLWEFDKAIERVCVVQRTSRIARKSGLVAESSLR